MRCNCSVCLKAITNDDAPVLTMGGYGNPRLLCEDCASDVETMTRSHDYDEITAAMDRITKRMSAANVDDKLTVGAMNDLLVTSAKRAAAIKDGSYDFSLDEVEEEDYEIPEELRETEEDRALEEKERKQIEKFDKVMNFVWIGVIVAAVAFLVWWFFF